MFLNWGISMKKYIVYSLIFILGLGIGTGIHKVSIVNAASEYRYTVTLTSEQKKALEWNIVDIQDWLDNFVNDKARKCMDRIVEQESQYQSDKITDTQKYQIVRDANIDTAAERQQEAEDMENINVEEK